MYNTHTHTRTHTHIIHGHQKTVDAHLLELAAKPTHHAPTHASNETLRQKMLFGQQEIVPDLQYGHMSTQQGRSFISLCSSARNDATRQNQINQETCGILLLQNSQTGQNASSQTGLNGIIIIFGLNVGGVCVYVCVFSHHCDYLSCPCLNSCRVIYFLWLVFCFPFLVIYLLF